MLGSTYCFSLSRWCLVKSLYGRLLSLCLVLIYSIRIATAIIISNQIIQNSRTAEDCSSRRRSYLFYAASFYYLSRLRLITFDIFYLWFYRTRHSLQNYFVIYTALTSCQIKTYVIPKENVRASKNICGTSVRILSKTL